MAATGLNASPGPEYTAQVRSIHTTHHKIMHISTETDVLLVLFFTQEYDRQYMHIGTMVEFAFALVGKLDVINKHSFNDFKLRVGELR